MQGVRRSRRKSRCAGTVLLVVGLFELAGLAGAQTDFRVEIHQGLVTLKARDAPLGEVLGEISRQTGLILELDGPGDEPITIELADVPVAAALERILKDRGYVYRRGRTVPAPDGSDVVLPGRLWVFSTRSGKTEDGTGAVRPCPGGNRGRQPIEGLVGCPERLELALAHTDAGVRREAVAELAEIGAAASVEILADVAQTDDVVVVRQEAIYGLGELRDPAGLQFLEPLLTDAERRVRAAAIDAIAQIGGEESAWTLAVSLADNDPSLREQAIYALEEIGGDAAGVILQQALGDEHDSVRGAAAEALEELAD